MYYSGYNKRTRQQAGFKAGGRPGPKRQQHYVGRKFFAPRAAPKVYGKPTQESKVSDIDTTTINISTTGSFTLLHVPVPGSDMTQRIGRKTWIKNTYIRGRVQTEAAGQTAATTIQTTAHHARLIVFVDKQPNGATPAVTDLLKEALPESQLNLNNRDRFSILRDQCYVFDPYANNSGVGGSSESNQVALVKEFVKVKQECIFNSNTDGDIDNINSGALFMFWIGSGTAGTNTDDNAIVSVRTRYLDA